jgi:UDP-glucose 4-epimerase
MKIFVTGGGGFLGSALCNALVRRGDRVTAFDLNFPQVLKPDSDNGLTLWRGDVTNPNHVMVAIKAAEPDAIIHAAAIVGIKPAVENPREVLRVNLGGSLNIFEAMQVFGVRRVIHISSEEVYGDIPSGLASEDHPTFPVMPYGVTKLATEHLGRSFRDIHGIECINLRISWVYGRSLPRPRVPKVLVDAIVERKPLHLREGGDSRMDHTYEDDFVAGTLLALDHKNHPFDTYNLASGTAPTLKELVDTLRSIEPTADISVGPGVYKHNETWPLPKKGALDSSRAAMAFGYRPNFDLRQGLEAYLAVCRDAKQRTSHS